MNGRDNPIISPPSQPDVNVGPTTAFGGNARKRAWQARSRRKPQITSPCRLSLIRKVEETPNPVVPSRCSRCSPDFRIRAVCGSCAMDCQVASAASVSASANLIASAHNSSFLVALACRALPVCREKSSSMSIGSALA